MAYIYLQDRFDRKGDGVPCGKGFISKRKKCSEKGRKTLAAALKAGDEGAKKRVEIGKRNAKERQSLKREVQRDKGKKARTILPTQEEFNPVNQVKDLNAKGIKVKAAPYQLTRREYIEAFPGTKKAIKGTFGDVEVRKLADDYLIDYPDRQKRWGGYSAVGKTLKEASANYAMAMGMAPSHYEEVIGALKREGLKSVKRVLETDYPDTLTSAEYENKFGRKDSAYIFLADYITRPRAIS